ncbi:MAG: hypothetical protein K0R38_6921 [Polyangiaceae bacterium]|jgi:hypothetical protein|nr:hypothetical protein [Polyangiaceae bacterium]
MGAGLSIGLCCSAGRAEAAPRHQGFTGDLGIGVSLMNVPSFSTSCGPYGGCTPVPRSSHFGLAPLSLSLGGFITPRVALLARAAGTSYFEDGTQMTHNFYGIIAEVWPIDEIFVSGGVGLGLYGPNPLFSRSSREAVGGWALDFRIGAALAQGTNHDFTLALEAIPGFYDGETVQGFALVGAWKWY